MVANYSGDEQFTSLYPVLKDYSIVEKLGAIVGDNATTNNTLCRTIEARLSKEEDVKWNSKHWRIHCTSHIINLTVQAFLFHSLIEIEQLELYDECYGPVLDRNGRQSTRLLTDTYRDTDPALV